MRHRHQVLQQGQPEDQAAHDHGPRVRRYRRRLSGRAALPGSPALGERVVMATTIGCGECRYCRAGHSNLCRKAEAIGFHYPGAMAPYVRVPAKAVRHGAPRRGGRPRRQGGGHRRAPLLRGERALAPAHGGDQERPRPGPRAPRASSTRWRPGPRARRRSSASEFPGARADLARALGLGEVLAPAEIDGAYLGLTEGEGFDLVVVTAPHGPTQAKSPMYARKGGFVSFFASLPQGEETLQVNSRTIHYGELSSTAPPTRPPRTSARRLALLEAKETHIRADSHARAADEGFHKAMDVIAAGRAVKVVLSGLKGKRRRNMDYAGYIDHTVLKPETGQETVARFCDEARHFGFAAVCVNPCWVAYAAERLAGSGVRGSDRHRLPARRQHRARQGVRGPRRPGGRGRRGRHGHQHRRAQGRPRRRVIEREIRGVVEAAGPAPVKVIIETSALTDEEKQRACVIAARAGAAFVKTSTGFGKGGATPEDVALMKKAAGPSVQVKASTGVKTREDADRLIAAGATRLGTSAGPVIVGGSAVRCSS